MELKENSGPLTSSTIALVDLFSRDQILPTNIDKNQDNKNFSQFDAITKNLCISFKIFISVY